MIKRTSLLYLIPLGAGLLIFSNLTPEPPDAERRPAPSLGIVLPPHALTEEPRQVEVERIVEEIDYAPAMEAFLETVVMQGSVGDQKAAIRELRKLGSVEAVQALSYALGDEDERVRKSAMEALRHIGSDTALAAIASATRARDAATRARAVEAMAGTDNYSAVDYLDLALHDNDPRVRAVAIESLGDIGDSRSINIISQALRDPDPDVRERAAEILDELNDEAMFQALFPSS